MTLHPSVYARLLKERIAEGDAQVWLVNTGWTGGPYGTGERIKLAYTRAMVRAALDGQLANADMREDEVFGFQVPTACPDVPSEVLDPRRTWSDDAANEAQARKLAEAFRDNFTAFEGTAERAAATAGPKLA